MRCLLCFLSLALGLRAGSPAETNRVRQLLEERKFAEAREAARAGAAAHPNDAEEQALLGRTLLQLDDSDGAIQAFERATTLAPKNGSYLGQLGEAYGQAAQKAGMFAKLSLGKKALAAFEKAVEVDPGNLSARYQLMLVYLQAPGVMGGGPAKARAQAAEIGKLDPVRGHVAAALVHVSEKEFGPACDEVQLALRSDPDNYAALFQLGRIAALSGERMEEGQTALARCLAMPASAGDPGHDAAHWRLGNLWEKKGDRKKARAEYEAALALTPGFPEAVKSLKKLE